LESLAIFPKFSASFFFVRLKFLLNFQNFPIFLWIDRLPRWWYPCLWYIYNLVPYWYPTLMILLSPMHFSKRTFLSSAAARLLRLRSSLSSLRFLLPPHRLPSQKADYKFPAEYSSLSRCFWCTIFFLKWFFAAVRIFFFPPSVKSLHSLQSLRCCCCCSSSSSFSSRWWIGNVVVLRVFYLHRQICLDLLERSVVVLLEYALENVELCTRTWGKKAKAEIRGRLMISSDIIQRKLCLQPWEGCSHPSWRDSLGDAAFWTFLHTLSSHENMR